MGARSPCSCPVGRFWCPGAGGASGSSFRHQPCLSPRPTLMPGEDPSLSAKAICPQGAALRVAWLGHSLDCPGAWLGSPSPEGPPLPSFWIAYHCLCGLPVRSRRSQNTASLYYGFNFLLYKLFWRWFTAIFLLNCEMYLLLRREAYDDLKWC